MLTSLLQIGSLMSWTTFFQKLKVDQNGHFSSKVSHDAHFFAPNLPLVLHIYILLLEYLSIPFRIFNNDKDWNIQTFLVRVIFTGIGQRV